MEVVIPRNGCDLGFGDGVDLERFHGVTRGSIKVDVRCVSQMILDAGNPVRPIVSFDRPGKLAHKHVQLAGEEGAFFGHLFYISKACEG